MEISLQEAYAGKNAQIRIPTSVTCEACSGSGAKAGTKPKSCPMCGGQGKVRHAQGFFTLERTCPNCQGRGQVIDSPCASCSGSGRVTRERTLSVNIPPGVEDGTRIRLAGEGEAGVRGGPPGDLYIFLSIGSHPFFQREGADLHCRVPVSMVTAAMGGEFEVPTIDGGKTRVKVPEGTQSGRRFRLQGKGMPVLRARQSGDMYVQVVVETPQNLTKKQRELLAEFDRLSSTATQPESAGFLGKVKEFLDGLGGRGEFGLSAAAGLWPPDVLKMAGLCPVGCHAAAGPAKIRTENRAADSPPGSQEEHHRAQDRAPNPAVRAEARRHRQEDRKADQPVRAEERHSARRRGALHPLLDRTAAVDRRGNAVGQGPGPRHGALCRSDTAPDRWSNWGRAPDR